MRLGAYSCSLEKGSRARQLYGAPTIQERHRHRYEFNNKYRPLFEKHGMNLSGLNQERDLVEIVEITEHPWFIGVQFHPEFKSKPLQPHPLFKGFVGAALDYKNRFKEAIKVREANKAPTSGKKAERRSV
jgi:CTP synthase